RMSAVSAVAAYRQALARFAEMTVLETWYSKVAMEEVFEEYADDPKALKQLKKSIAQAAHNTTEHVFHKITAVENGTPHITHQPPLLYHPDPSELDMGRDVRPFLENYHQMQKNSAAPQEQTAPPKPARSWAISGTRRGLKARNSSGLRPMKTRSCGTNT